MNNKLKLAIFLVIFLFITGNPAKISATEIIPPKNPNSAKGCAICHYRWVDSFYVEGKSTDLAAYSSKKSVATAEMCFSCHDGSVVDSRTVKHLIHKMGKPVRNNIKIPDMFSLNENNSLYCGTCHSPHALPSGSKAQGTIFMRASLKNSELCLMCHTDKEILAGSPHDLRTAAKEEKNLKGKTVLENGPCSACHLQHSTARNLNDQDDYSTALCLSCHVAGKIAASSSLSGVQHPAFLRPAMINPEVLLPLFDSFGNRDKEGVITCSTCHDPHKWVSSVEKNIKPIKDSRTNSFLRKPAPEICLDCHPAQADVIGSPHDLSVSAPLTKNTAGQLPEESGACGSCHLVHNGKNKILLWGRKYGNGENFMETVCNSCHSISGCARHKVPEVYYHPREKLANNQGRNVRGKPNYFPIFHPGTGQLVAKGNISCPSCHSVHQPEPEIGSSLNIFEVKKEIKFLRPKQAFSICVKCHKEKAKKNIEEYHKYTRRKFKLFF